jgi:hypothetical protein
MSSLVRGHGRSPSSVDAGGERTSTGWLGDATPRRQQKDLAGRAHPPGAGAAEDGGDWTA